jgi:hypothetical protein
MSSLDSRKAMIVMVLAVVLTGGIMSACTPQAVKPLPVSPWGEDYLYSYKPPVDKPAALTPVTIAVVEPCLSKKSIFDPLYRRIVRGFIESMAFDLSRMITTKGMTATGPFETPDMMTYPDRKDADLALTPCIFLDIQSRDITGWREETNDVLRLVKSVEMKVDGWVYLVFREPLSLEGLWIRKIQVGGLVEKAEIVAERAELRSRYGYRLIGPGRILYDGRKDAIADMIKKIYAEIMQIVWKHIDPGEILILRGKAEELSRSLPY